jgi:hypothetical protein
MEKAFITEWFLGVAKTFPDCVTVNVTHRPRFPSPLAAICAAGDAGE